MWGNARIKNLETCVSWFAQGKYFFFGGSLIN